MLDDGVWSDENEKFILKARDALILEALKAGNNVIVDDTNLHSRHKNHIWHLVADLATVEMKDFTDVPLEVCIERDSKREGRAKVGEKVIRGMHEQFMIGKVKVDKNLGTALKQFAKTQEAIEKVEALPKPVLDPNLPVAIICDIDGTLALRGDRGVYDFKRCEIDAVQLEVKVILDLIYDAKLAKIIILSGREDFFKTETVNWLNKHQIPYDKVYMRNGGDHRNDAIVKKEIYEATVKGKYNVLFVLDDRQRVVDMWRQQGLVCFQVAEGNF